MKLALLLSALVLLVHGDWNSSPTKLKPTSNNAEQNFGNSIAIDDTYLIVGADKDDYKDVKNVGSITIFVKNYTHTLWMKSVKLTSPDKQKDDRFGRDVDIHNGNIIVGGSKAYIVQYKNAVWSFEQGLNVGCGHSVAIHGDYAVVGCAEDDIVHIYNAPNWNHLHSLKLKGNKKKKFGETVAVHGSYLAVESDKAIYIYKVNENGKTWRLNKEVPTSTQPQKVGTRTYNVAMNGERLAFVSEDSNKSYVYVYKTAGTSWNLEESIQVISPYVCIAMQGESIIIGSLENGVNSGDVDIYKLVNGAWKFHKKLISNDVVAGDRFGAVVALWNNIYVCGAPYDDAQGTNSGAVYQFDSAVYTIECYGNRYQATWAKYSLSGSKLKITLKNQSCDSYSTNSTHVWVTSLFEDCGTTIVETDTQIIVTNTATVTILTYVSKSQLATRARRYQYNIECSTKRRLELSQKPFNIRSGVSVAISSGEISIDLRLIFEFYKDHTFTTSYVNEVNVTSNDTLYGRIKEIKQVHNYKFVVNHCFASPSSDPENRDTDAVFRNKCPLDQTFDIVQRTSNTFNFEIKIFDYIKFRKSVYFHCVITICNNASSTQECTQSCESRGTDVTKDSVSRVKEVVLTSNKINFYEVLSCKDKVCGDFSRCVQLQIPICICFTDYVMSIKTKVCTNARILKFRGVHLKLQWANVYENKTSSTTLQMMIEKDEGFIKLFVQMKTLLYFDGFRITNVRQGSIIFDVDILYSNNTTIEKAVEVFQRTITTPSKTTTFSQGADSMLVITGFTPVYVQEVPKDSNNSKIFIYVIIVCVLFVLLMFIIVCVVRRRRQNRE